MELYNYKAIKKQNPTKSVLNMGNPTYTNTAVAV
jgi:hypothetical protein